MVRSWTGELAVTVLVWATVLMGLWVAGPAPAQTLPSLAPIEILPEAIEGNERYLDRGLIGIAADPAAPEVIIETPMEPVWGPAVGT